MERIANFKEHPCNNRTYVDPSKSHMHDSEILLQGTGNVLFVEDGVSLERSKINFMGSDSVIYLSKSSCPYYVSLAAGQSSAIFIGRENYFNDTVHILATEWQNIIIGGGCAISFGIWLRTADPHLIYDVDSRERINYSKPILVGDHVWIGQNALILKGTQIGSGAIIGGGSVVSNKRIPSNASYAGSPAKQIRKCVFWTGPSTHTWSSKDTENRRFLSEAQANGWVYKNSPETQSLEELSQLIQQQTDASDRLSIIKKFLVGKQSKDRFYIGADISTAAESQ